MSRSQEALPDREVGRVSSEITAREVLAILNGISTLWVSAFGIPGLDFPSENSADENELSARDAQKHRDRLREYVDLWLATGRDKDAVETPTDRRPTREIDAIVQEFFKTHRALAAPLRDGYAVTVIPSVDYFSLQDERTVELVPLMLGRIGDPRMTHARGRHPNLYDMAEDAAQRMFVGMLISDWRLRIAKCNRANCSRYFMLKHVNRSYKRGTFCDDCTRIRSLESAARKTDIARKNATLTLYRLVASRFSSQVTKNVRWYEDPRLCGKIVGYLNDRINRTTGLRNIYRGTTRDGVTLKWLARNSNRIGIEMVLKDGMHAKD